MTFRILIYWIGGSYEANQITYQISLQTSRWVPHQALFKTASRTSIKTLSKKTASWPCWPMGATRWASWPSVSISMALKSLPPTTQKQKSKPLIKGRNSNYSYKPWPPSSLRCCTQFVFSHKLAQCYQAIGFCAGWPASCTSPCARSHAEAPCQWLPRGRLGIELPQTQSWRRLFRKLWFYQTWLTSLDASS